MAFQTLFTCNEYMNILILFFQEMKMLSSVLLLADANQMPNDMILILLNCLIIKKSLKKENTHK